MGKLFDSSSVISTGSRGWTLPSLSFCANVQQVDEHHSFTFSYYPPMISPNNIACVV